MIPQPDTIWRNRGTFLNGREEVVAFLTKKWEKEKSYRLRKELFAFSENKIAVQFWYEFQDAHDGMKWKRCYGLEDWTFADDGKMRKRQMSGNDIEIDEAREYSRHPCVFVVQSKALIKVHVERWFKDGVDVNTIDISESHW